MVADSLTVIFISLKHTTEAGTLTFNAGWGEAMTHPQLVHHLTADKDKVLNACPLCCSIVHMYVWASITSPLLVLTDTFYFWLKTCFADDMIYTSQTSPGSFFSDRIIAMFFLDKLLITS